MGLCYGEITESPLGAISLIAGDNGLQHIAFTTLRELKAERGEWVEEPSLQGLETIGTLLSEINAYLFGIRKAFSINIDWSVLPPFQYSVLQLASQIPYGEIRTYGELANQLGKPGAARAVGKALGDNPMPIIIPCHRVVDSTWSLRGYSAPNGIKTKAFLLNLEGHQISDEKVLPKTRKVYSKEDKI